MSILFWESFFGNLFTNIVQGKSHQVSNSAGSPAQQRERAPRETECRNKKAISHAEIPVFCCPCGRHMNVFDRKSISLFSSLKLAYLEVNLS